jgi:hypothetical protein
MSHACSREHDEGTHEETGGRNRECQCEEIGDVQRQIHEHGQRHVRHNGGHKAQQTATEVRLGIEPEALSPKPAPRNRPLRRPLKPGCTLLNRERGLLGRRGCARRGTSHLP